MPVPTAADYAERTAPPPFPFVPPTRLGSLTGDPVTVSGPRLGATLRQLLPSGADISHRRGWWALTCFGGDLAVEGPDLDSLAAHAVAALRAAVADTDPDQGSDQPLAWLVRLSDDAQLRRWLHIPDTAGTADAGR